jgi:hypothetical protein
LVGWGGGAGAWVGGIEVGAGVDAGPQAVRINAAAARIERIVKARVFISTPL